MTECLTIERAAAIQWSALVAGVLEPRVHSLARARGAALLPELAGLRRRVIDAQLAANRVCVSAALAHYFPDEPLQSEVLDGTQLHRVASELRRILEDLESGVRGAVPVSRT